jgi:hypothetical protein
VAKTGRILCLEILCEPVAFVVIALLVSRAGFGAAADNSQQPFPFAGSLFISLSIVMILAPNPEVGVIILLELFPRNEKFKEIIMAGIMKENTLQPAGGEL